MQTQLILAVIALLICGTCSNLIAQTAGTSETDSDTEAFPATEKSLPASNAREQEIFYDANQVQTIHLQITDSDRQKMQAALP